MTNLTVTAGPGIEEVAGKNITEVLALAKRLGHIWPFKSCRIGGVWVNTYAVEEANHE